MYMLRVHIQGYPPHRNIHNVHYTYIYIHIHTYSIYKDTLLTGIYIMYIIYTYTNIYIHIVYTKKNIYTRKPSSQE